MFSNLFKLISTLVLVFFVLSSFSHDYHIDSHEDSEERILCHLYQNNIDTPNVKLEVITPYFALLSQIESFDYYQFTPSFSAVTPRLRAPPFNFSNN